MEVKIESPDDKNPEERAEHDGSGNRSSEIIRLLKPVEILPDEPGEFNAKVISPRFYSRFNYSLIGRDRPALNMAIGITSPNRGEGKTLVAANLAVSFATANMRDTVIVDLNLASPKLHSIFGTSLAPGLVDSLSATQISVSRTKIKHLFVLPVGSLMKNRAIVEHVTSEVRGGKTSEELPSLGLEQVAPFRDVLYSLKQSFEIVVVDMPSLQEPNVPILLTHQMAGLVVVVGANRTKHDDIERMLRRVNHSQVLGFVFNRVSEGDDR